MSTLIALAAAAQSKTAPFEGLKNLGSVVQSLAAVGAVIVGAFWTYYRFYSERTYRPRLALAICATPVELSGSRALHCRVTVENIGVSAVWLQNVGSGLRLTAASTPPPTYERPQWNAVDAKVYRVFERHRWIESKEQISEELTVGVSADDVVWLLELRIVCKWKATTIAITTNRVVPPFQSTALPEGGRS
jgi:hypothetical protein